MAVAKKPSGLGRGLSALLGELNPTPALSEAGTVAAVAPTLTLPIDQIVANPKQPRRQFEETALAELVQSIQERGILQPILVRPLGPNRYEVVAGERRWRAAQRARLVDVPVVIRTLDDGAALEIALIENIQRRDLNPIEEAEAYRRLMDDFGHAAGDVGQLVGKSRAHVANLVRLLDLPSQVRTWVVEGHVSMGHARALLLTKDPVGLARQVIERGLSVRQTEILAAEAKPSSNRRAAPAVTLAEKDADTRALERDLSARLGMKVAIAFANGRGTMTISYADLDQLDDLCQRLSGPAAAL